MIFSRSGLLHLLGAEVSASSEEDNIAIRLDVRMQRCGIESKLILEGESPGNAHQRTVKAIQDALRKALAWNQELVSGEIESMSLLAKKEDVTQRYIAHIIKLAWLSPDIIQSILRGQIPATLSLDTLKKGFPLDWHEQWQTLDFDKHITSQPN